ncbi:hypothetical protein GGF40_001337 [Coemansia sp. RSA 1286]|nr:hypothetical protein IWW45_005910 [Coemansia sp. RSA 485]KAJ2601356.1 hypothetical protein GGF39_001272 [Coemansia sp. RSA 1721]KAJ2638861.1 hypothetical protein GGF40_001337 [Coemansia sp. RSA 1286]
MLDIESTSTHKRKDRSIYRHSWSSDEPSSSSNSVISGKESKSSLWSKLRKQASRIHNSSSSQQPSTLIGAGVFSSQSTISRGAGASYSMDQPRTLISGHNVDPASNVSSRTLLSHPPVVNKALSGSHLHGGAARPSTPHQRQPHSMDIPRSTFRMSVDTADHRDPRDISVESIRRTLGAYTGKSESKAMPRLRRLMTPSDRRSNTVGFVGDGHPAAGLARIAEDDEQPGTAGSMQVSPISGSRVAPAFRVDAKRFSENSGSTVSSSDTVGEPNEQLRLRPRSPRLSIGSIGRPMAMYEDINGQPPSPTREHPPKLLPMVHGQVAPAKELALDPVVYRNTFFNARPLNDQQQIESAIKKHGVYRPLTKSASDETLNTHRLSTAESTPPRPRTSLRDSSIEVSFSVRFCDTPQTIPTPDMVDESQRKLSTSMPALSAAKPAASRRLRRPSEPVRPSWWSPMSPQSSPAAADAEYSRRLQLELAALKRSVRSLQLQNDVLSELASVDPVDNVPDAVRTRMRTLELENLWLKNELRRMHADRSK